MNLKIANWNLERKAPNSWQSLEICDLMKKFDAEINCFTEGWKDSSKNLGGHEISGNGVQWSRFHPSERKVVLQSKMPWEDVDSIGNGGCEFGGFVSGKTITSIGKVKCVGVCIPYFGASPYLQQPKSPQWQEHRRFLNGIAKLVSEHDYSMPLIILGDFNQKSPPTPRSRAVYEELVNALAKVKILTHGEKYGLIDHVAATNPLSLEKLEIISNYNDAGQRLSDHVGVFAALRFS